MQNEIILYQADGFPSHIEVRVENDTVWLNRLQISALFDRDVKTIGKHINNVFTEEELQKDSTVANFAIVQMEGGRRVNRQIEFYNLDVIISVGYRVKSKQGTQFRIWANKILKDYLLKGYSLNNRMNRIDDNLHKLTEKVNDIDLQINANLPPNQNIFYEGQIFDAYTLIANIIRTANKSIIVIDNYIDDTVFKQLTKRNKNTKASIYTKPLDKVTKQDLQKHNAQYPKIEIKKLTTSHDRFMIIDNKTVYHFGASLKDAGKKWFAFTKLKMDANDIIEKLKENEL